MSVASADIGISDDTAKDATGCVRGETEYDVTDQIGPVLDVVVAWKMIEHLEFVIEICGDLRQVVSAVLSGDDVLDLQLADLLRIDERIAVPIMGVSELVGLLYGEAYLPGLEMGGGDVRHVEAYGSVLVDAQVVLLPEDPLLQVLGDLQS